MTFQRGVAVNRSLGEVLSIFSWAQTWQAASAQRGGDRLVSWYAGLYHSCTLRLCARGRRLRWGRHGRLCLKCGRIGYSVCIESLPEQWIADHLPSRIEPLYPLRN